MPAMAYAAETNGEEQAEAQPSEAVMGDKPVDGDALAIGTEEADAAEFGGAVSVRPEIQSEDAGAENAAGGAEDSDDVVPDERERSLLAEGSSFRYEYAGRIFRCRCLGVGGWCSLLFRCRWLGGSRSSENRGYLVLFRR